MRRMWLIGSTGRYLRFLLHRSQFRNEKKNFVLFVNKLIKKKPRTQPAFFKGKGVL